MPADTAKHATSPSLGQVAAVFLKIGLIGFGGPAAHVALMRREIVERRRWVDEERFLRMFAACNIIPGPTSTELALYLGYDLAGWPALLLAGLLFILPAMLLMLLIASIYAHFGTTPPIRHILYGIRPVVVGIIAWAVLDLGRRIISSTLLLPVALTVCAFFLLGLNPALLLLLAGLAVAGAVLARQRRRSAAAFVPALTLPAIAGSKLATIFFTFLKIGAISFGSGYVLLAFLRADFVVGLHWLTDQQLLDVVAISQATPGPVFTTATFLGYLFAGVPGAIVATVGIFLPGFILVPFLNTLVAFVEHRSWARAFLNGVNVGALGLIVAVLLQLARSSIVDVPTFALAIAAFAVLIRYPLATPALVLAGALAGLVIAR